MYSKTGNAHRIGVTGPPGAGKSSLIDNLISQYRANDKSVAVLCIDPTSPFSGGAILGDRIRMLNHYSDEGVFIRSMASRNASGGLSLASSLSADVLDSFGFDVIIFETLGVGQVEIDVINEADTVLVILVPESGDEIQMMKSGLIEIADLYVINKSDRDGSDKLAVSLKNMLDSKLVKHSKWNIPVIKTNSLNGTGIKDVIESLHSHIDYLSQEKLLIKKINDRYKIQVNSLIVERFKSYFWKKDKRNDMLVEEMKKKIKDRMSPLEFVDRIAKNEKF